MVPYQTHYRGCTYTEYCLVALLKNFYYMITFQADKELVGLPTQ